MNDNAQNNDVLTAEPRLQVRYREELVPRLMETLGRENKLAVPRLDKIVLNMGVGLAKDEESLLKEACDILTTISGQKPVVTKARKSVAGFKLRVGMPIGCKVTLRRNRMYEFIDRLVNVVFPRIRDFRGFPIRSFDGTGNYSLGIDEHVVFPEVDPDKYNNLFGLDITVCTTANDDAEAKELLDLFGFPFQK